MIFFARFEKRVKKLDVQYSIVGYCTVYNFYAYPDKIRSRISQFLIFPPFQKLGHGRTHSLILVMVSNFYISSEFLLNALYQDLLRDDVKDITVEGPSPQFSHLRDLVDCINLAKASFFVAKDLKPLEKETIDAIQAKLKLSVVQTCL